MTIWSHVTFELLHDLPSVAGLVTEDSYAGKVAGGCEATPRQARYEVHRGVLLRDASHRLIDESVQRKARFPAPLPGLPGPVL